MGGGGCVLGPDAGESRGSALESCRRGFEGFKHVLPDLCAASGDFREIRFEVRQLGTQLRLGLLQVLDALAGRTCSGGGWPSLGGLLGRCVAIIALEAQPTGGERKTRSVTVRANDDSGGS